MNKAISVLVLQWRSLSLKKKKNQLVHPDPTWNWSWVRDLKLWLLTQSVFVCVVKHSVESQIPNFWMSSHNGVAAVWSATTCILPVALDWGCVEEQVAQRNSPNKSSGHQPETQLAKPKEVCSESGMLAKPVISQKPMWSWATELSERAGFFLSFSKAHSVGWAIL